MRSIDSSLHQSKSVSTANSPQRYKVSQFCHNTCQISQLVTIAAVDPDFLHHPSFSHRQVTRDDRPLDRDFTRSYMGGYNLIDWDYWSFNRSMKLIPIPYLTFFIFKFKNTLFSSRANCNFTNTFYQQTR